MTSDHVLGGPLARATRHGDPDPVTAPVFLRWRTESVRLSPIGRMLLAVAIVMLVWGVYNIFHPLKPPVLAAGAMVGLLSYYLLQHVRRRPAH